MNTDLELYRVFYTVAKHKHMTKASEELHISQPAISQSIKKLEDQLGGTLFLRSNKGMELTEEGKMFYEVNSKNKNGYNLSYIAIRYLYETYNHFMANYNTNNFSKISLLFYGTYENTIICSECKNFTASTI